MKTRRDFLTSTAFGLVGTAVAPDAIASARAQEPTQEPAGMPPAFGTARSGLDIGPLPGNDADIAFATVTQLSRWIETKKLSSERLTNIYLKRLEEFNPRLRCVITLTREHAVAQAKKADAEIAAGKY